MSLLSSYITLEQKVAKTEKIIKNGVISISSSEETGLQVLNSIYAYEIVLMTYIQQVMTVQCGFLAPQYGFIDFREKGFVDEAK